MLETSYINRFITGISLLKRRIIPIHSRPLSKLVSPSFDEPTNAIVNQDSNCSDIQTTNKFETEETYDWSIPLRNLQQCGLSMFRESPVLITISSAGLVTLDPHPNIMKNWNVLTTKGISGVVPNEPFYVLIGNFYAQAVHTPKWTYVAFSPQLPENITYFHLSSTPKKRWEGRGKEVTKTNNSNIVNIKPL